MADFARLHVAIACLSNDVFAPPGNGWIGGGQLGAYENGRYLVSQGARVTYILRRTELSQRERQSFGPRCTVLRVSNGVTGGGKPGELGASLMEMVSDGVDKLQAEPILPNMVHSQYWLGGALGRAISQALAIRHIHFFLSLGRLTDPLNPHSSTQRKIRDELELKIYEDADCLVAQSTFVAEKFKVLYPEISHDRVSVIHHGVDHKVFTRRPESTGDYLRRSATRFG